MDCSNCGAPLTAVRSGAHFVCDFCGSFVLPNKTEDGVVVVGGPGQRACPVCAQPLLQAAVERLPVEHCDRCGGVLCDRRTFKQIIERLRARHSGPKLAPEPIDPSERERKLDCPACGRGMDLHPYYGPGNVMIDSCDACHLVWLDKGEVAIIVRS